MMKNKQKVWIIIYISLVLAMLAIAGVYTYKVDPFFHFHKPNTDKYFYLLNSQRNQNDGIVRNFEYDGIITGTSMTENFKTTEAEKWFGGSFVKVPFSGGTYKEMNDNLKVALSHNDNIRMIIRGLDIGMFFNDKDAMREDLGTYPTYLYDDNVFNDVKYVFNRNVIFSRIYPMIKESGRENFQGGITSFDEYANWMSIFSFGKNVIASGNVFLKEISSTIELTQDERKRVLENVRQNVTDLADSYPNVTFYYFFTPYSVWWWKTQLEEGLFVRQLEAEKIIIEEILSHPNIKLYSFNCLFDITTDLNNYRDMAHYGEWINSLILKYISENKCLLTKDNYEEYLSEEKEFYSTYDYSQLNNQIDYENDYYMAALLNEEINDVTPHKIELSDTEQISLSNAELVNNQYNGENGVVCSGRLQRNSDSVVSVADYLKQEGYVGFSCTIDDLSAYSYLIFHGKKLNAQGQLGVYIYNQEGVHIRDKIVNYVELDNEWHQYYVDVSDISGAVTIIFNGGYVDSTGSTESKYVFSNVTLY